MASALPGLGSVVYRFGYALRETAQALNRVGARLQGNYAFREQRACPRPRWPAPSSRGGHPRPLRGCASASAHRFPFSALRGLRPFRR